MKLSEGDKSLMTLCRVTNTENNMNRIELILEFLEGNVKDFAECCNSKILDSNLVSRLDTGLIQGCKLVDNINEVMDHLTSIKEKLEKTS